MEEQLREEAPLARLGEMAAAVAHEVKNPLAGIRGAIQITGRRLPTAKRLIEAHNGRIAIECPPSG